MRQHIYKYLANILLALTFDVCRKASRSSFSVQSSFDCIVSETSKAPLFRIISSTLCAKELFGLKVNVTVDIVLSIFLQK